VVVGLIAPLRQLVVRGPLSALFEAMRTLGQGYLPAVLLILAGSLTPPDEKPATKGDGDGDHLWKQISCIACLRFILMPALGITIITTLRKLFPHSSILSDKLLLFIILLEMSMPSAQNSTVILQLQKNPAGAAKMAKILLLVYVIGVPAMTYWLARILKFTDIM
jgi:predicted permease